MKSIILTIDPQVLASIEHNLHNKYTYLQVQQVNQNIKAKNTKSENGEDWKWCYKKWHIFSCFH